MKKNVERWIRTTEYMAWESLKSRCYSVKNLKYPIYGGRGITVCERWKNSFKNFIDDMGMKPTPQHSIDRIDNNGNYEPNNCRWATIRQQNINKSNSVKITHNGDTMCISEWAEKLNMDKRVIYKRHQFGNISYETLFAPVKSHKPKNYSPNLTTKANETT